MPNGQIFGATLFDEGTGVSAVATFAAPITLKVKELQEEKGERICRRASIRVF
jgi:hypothetical protein